jgi:transposase
VSDTPGVADDAAGLRAANARLRGLLVQRDAEITGLRAEGAELRAQVAKLQEQVADLAAGVGQNSKNSSKPPSSDGLGKPAPKSLRGKTGRRPGRPKGQPGVTMQLTDHPDRVVRHVPGCCGTCGGSLAGAEQAGMQRRQVTEIPPVRAEVTEHQIVELECGGCGARTRGRAPGG